MVAETSITALSNGDESGIVEQAAHWFDMSMILGLINSAWKQDNNFIVFVCYTHPAKTFLHETNRESAPLWVSAMGRRRQQGFYSGALRVTVP